MKLVSVLAVLAAGSFGVVAALSTVASADDDPAKNVTLAAKRESGKVGIKITPASSWYVNSEYPIKCTLKSSGALGKAELKKEDATFVDSGKPGKAKEVIFSTTADQVVEGECKLVICSDNSCSSPFKVPVKSN